MTDNPNFNINLSNEQFLLTVKSNLRLLTDCLSDNEAFDPSLIPFSREFVRDVLGTLRMTITHYNHDTGRSGRPIDDGVINDIATLMAWSKGADFQPSYLGSIATRLEDTFYREAVKDTQV